MNPDYIPVAHMVAEYPPPHVQHPRAQLERQQKQEKLLDVYGDPRGVAREAQIGQYQAQVYCGLGVLAIFCAFIGLALVIGSIAAAAE